MADPIQYKFSDTEITDGDFADIDFTVSDPPKRAAKKTAPRVKPEPPKGAGSGQIKTAMATLNNAHNILSFALMVVSPTAAEVFESERADLDARNQAILEADPELAKRISAMAAKGGGFALVMSHGVAILPAAGIVRMEMKARAADRAAKVEATQEEEARIYEMRKNPTDPDFFSG